MGYELISKYLKNVTNMLITSENGSFFPPEIVIPVNTGLFNDILNDDKLLNNIKKGNLLVSGDGETFFGNPLQGFVFFLNQFDNGGMVIWNDNIINLVPSLRRDPLTGIEGTSLSISIFQMLRDFYNDPTNPLYTGENLNSVYWDKVPNLKKAATYLHNVVKTKEYKRPERLIEYDGEQDIEHLLKFDMVIFNEPSSLIEELKSTKPLIFIIGKVDCVSSYDTFVNNTDAYSDVDCIYITNSGYNHGTQDTNKRSVFNRKVDYVHENNMKVMLDCDNNDHIYGTINDPDFPNTTWNEDLEESSYGADDWFILNGFVSAFPTKEEWLEKMNKLFTLRRDINVSIAALTDINRDDPDKQIKFDSCFLVSLMTCIDAFGVQDGDIYIPITNVLRHGSLWEAYPKLIVDGDYIKRYISGYTISVDFSGGFNNTIEAY